MYGIDWVEHFRPAALAWIAGGDPYAVAGYYNPPWLLPILAPLALLPAGVGRWALFAVTFALLALAARRMGNPPLMVVLVLLSPPALHGWLNANVDPLALAGLLLPVPLGLPLLLLKAQVGAGAALVLLIGSWRRGGLVGLARTLAPLALLLVWSWARFGAWPLVWLDAPGRSVNASLWPWGLAVGVPTLALALRRGSLRLGLMAAPFCAPHVVFHSYVGGLL